MAIALEFIDFIVPIKNIREKYPGGWEGCLRDHARLIGGRVWYDEHLFRDGAMSPRDIRLLVDEWAAMGFEIPDIAGDNPCWKDLCVAEFLFGGATLPCEWLAFVPDQRAAYMKGYPPGEIISRENFEYAGGTGAICRLKERWQAGNRRTATYPPLPCHASIPDGDFCLTGGE